MCIMKHLKQLQKINMWIKSSMTLHVVGFKNDDASIHFYSDSKNNKCTKQQQKKPEIYLMDALINSIFIVKTTQCWTNEQTSTISPPLSTNITYEAT